MDVFKANENKQLKDRIAQLEAMLTPEQAQIDDLQTKIHELNTLIEDKQNQIIELEKTISKNENKIKQLDSEIQRKKAASLSIDDDFRYQQFGLYRPRYKMAHSDEYKAKLDEIRVLQKDLIKNGKAIIGNTDWTVSGSAAKGKKMVKDMQKLLLRAFNSEWDELGDKVKSILFKPEKGTKLLELSGTPFNILSNYEDDDDSVFTWDYVMEQQAKQKWEETHFGDSNPYSDLPEMRMYTYDLGKLIKADFIDVGDKAFNFTEFFRTNDTGCFVHEINVNDF